MLDMAESVGYNGLVDHSGGISSCADVLRFIRWALLILGSYQSGQMGLTVNQLSSTSGVRIPHCPPIT